jgi:glycosyltransferase involved in cell wall biosynthesis
MSRSVSIVATCYNFRPYIAETLQSLAAQTHRDFEVIVVDNNSTDGSVEIIESIAASDSRFVLVREPQQGVHHALNAGIARASGHIVLLLDGDDLFRPERLARTIRTFEETGADFVACNGQRIDAAGRLEELFDGYFHSAEAVPAVMCQFNPIWTVSFLALTRDALERVGPLPERYSRILDWHLLMSAYEHDLRIAFLDEPLVLKRYHGKNLAFDVEMTESQAIPRIACFLKRYEPLSAIYGADERSRLLTVRYVRAFEQMRRNGRWEALTDYLAGHVGEGGVRPDVQRFVSAIAWYHLDRRRFVREADSLDGAHPLCLFVRGLATLERGDAVTASRQFECAFVKPMRRFFEAFNSWAIAVATFDRPRAIALLEQLLHWTPDYRDARLNLTHLRQGHPEQCRHTVTLRPETLYWLAEWP